MFRPSKKTDADSSLRVERLSIQDGQWQREPANVQIVPTDDRRGQATRGDLYLVIEAPHGVSVPPGLFTELTQVIADTYQGMSRSVTRGLREGLLAANSLLFERNLRADSEHQVVLGLNCAVVRDDGAGNPDVYMAQMGPSLITHIHEEQVVRFPADSIWLRSENPGTLDLSRQPPAGLRRDLEPDLWHANLAPGDVLIISTTDLARLASRREIIARVGYAGDQSPRRAIEALADGRNLGAIVIDWPGERVSASEVDMLPQTAPSPTPPLAPVVPPSARSTSARISPAPESERPPAPIPTREAAIERVDEDDERFIIDNDEEELDEEVFADRLPEPAARPSRATSAPSAGRTPAGQGLRHDLAGLRENVSRGAETLRRGAEDALLNVLPSEAPERPRIADPERAADAEERISLSGKALVMVALIIPLVMLALIIMTRIQYERTRVEQFNSLQALAQAQYDNAIKMPSDGETRRGLEEAMRTVRDGLAINAGDEELASLQRRIVHKMEEIDRVELLHNLWKLRDLDDAPISPTDSSRIVVHGIDVFVLNRGSSKVFKFLLNDAGDAFLSADTDPVLMQKGEMRGGITVGDIVDIAWMEAGGDRTLSTFMALERTGYLLAYDPQQGIDVLPVADSDMWLKPDAIGSYFGNLYVLDPLLSRVLKYVPQDNAYTVAPTNYVPPQFNLDLTGAVDMTIDGSVYILFADGQVKKFLTGEPQPFTLQGLPSPMRSPTTIFVSGPQEPDGAGYVYVGDTGNERILQFDKSGTYLRQFKVPTGEEHMKQLRGIYVDEPNQRLIFLSGRTLWASALPHLQR